jgi:uncharacterized damage-inducible protein DinB
MKLADLFSNYFTVRVELVDAVRNLSRAQLDWVPSGHQNSIGRLLAHIAETECFWISSVALQEGDVDWSTFEGSRPLGELLSLLERYFHVFGDYLRREDIEGWDSVFYERKETGERFSKRWLAWHVVEHQARHRGQILMLLRMQGAEVPHV